MAFKRLAKVLKNKSLMLRKTYASATHHKDFLDTEIGHANVARWNAKFGSSAITMTNIRQKPQEIIQYRDIDTGFIFADEEVARSAEMRNFHELKKPFIPKRKKERKKLYKTVIQQVEKYNYDLSIGNTEKWSSDLSKKLKPKKFKNVTRNRRMSAVEMIKKMQKEEILEEQKLQSGDHNVLYNEKDDMNEKYMEYIKGTEIYYGSTVSLQAKHGGFLSFNNKSDIKASAHKTLPHARYVILKSEDLSDKNVVRYGDAVWLQAGASEVLGAMFSGKIAAKGRTLNPSLISSKRTNMFKAQQYGRWLLLNKNDPVGTIGQAVLHLDPILVEQEWYYLASSAPSNSFMYRIPTSLDEVLDKDKGMQNDEWDEETRERHKVNFFKTGDECVWSIKLTGISQGGGSGENKRAELLSKSQDQIKASTSRRFQAAGTILYSLSSTVPEELLPEHLRETLLEHKTSEFLTQKKYIDRFVNLSAKGFSVQPSIKFIENLYGTDSSIYKKKKEVQEMKDAEIGIEKPPVKFVDIVTHNRKDLEETRYWDRAQKLLIPTQTWVELDTAMSKYYRIDFKKKLNAVIVLQNAVRKYLNRKWDFEREFETRERNCQVRRHKRMLAHRTHFEEENSALASPATDWTRDDSHLVQNSAKPEAGRKHNRINDPNSIVKKAPLMGEINPHHAKLKRDLSSGDLIGSIDAHTQVLHEDHLKLVSDRELHALESKEEYDLTSAERDILRHEHAKRKKDDLFVPSKVFGDKVIKMSRLEDEILKEVHMLDPIPMADLLSHEEKVKQEMMRQEMDHAKEVQNDIDTRGYAPLRRPSPHSEKIPKRGQSAIVHKSSPDSLAEWKKLAQAEADRTSLFNTSRPETAPTYSTKELRQQARLEKQKDIIKKAKDKMCYSASNLGKYKSKSKIQGCISLFLENLV